MRQSDNCEACPPAVRVPHGFTVRALHDADILVLAALWVDSWGETLPTIDFAQRRPWLEAFLADPAIVHPRRCSRGGDDE